MPVLPEFIPLSKQKEMFAISSWRESPRAAPSQPAPPTPTPAAAAVAERETAAAQGKAHRSRRSRGRGKAQQQQQSDVDDFFVNCVLPSGVGLAALRTELVQHSTTPLRAYEIGSPRALLQRRNGNAHGAHAGDPTSSGAFSPVGGGEAPPLPTHVTGRPHGRVPSSSSAELLPFRTPVALAAQVDEGEEYPGAPLPDLALPPSVPADILQKGHLMSLLFAESAEAEKVSELLQKKWPQATVMVVSRNRSVLNTSLVLKGLPSLTKTERLIEELEKSMPHKPSYIRLHRGERGVFKNVVFFKYPNREIAEESKLRLERFVVGSRLLKVEFKKKEKGTAERERGTTLLQLVRDLRVSTEHEGFVYQRDDLTKDEVKLLKQHAHSYGLSFDLNEKTVVVKRIFPASGRPSPALRPTAAAALANLAPTAATPGTLRPMDFKGIRHWKEMRCPCPALGIMRPKGPGDVPPFAPGRGRPI